MILVVDDDKEIVKLLQTAIENAGYEVDTAADGLEAYQQMKSRNYDCMLLDISMPKINGAELLLLMQAEGISLPAIVMATFPGFDKEEMRQFANVVEFFSKPFEMKDMIQAIRKHASRE